MNAGPHDEERADDDDRLRAIASAMRETFGERAAAVAERQIALADPEWPSVTARWQSIVQFLKEDFA